MLKYARVVAATLALTTALVVSGCSSDLPATPSPSPTPTATMAVDTAPPDALACGDLVADATIHDLMGPATLFA